MDYTVRQSPPIIIIHALIKLPFEELNAHDGKNEPKQQTDEEDIKNGWNGVH